MTMKMQQKMIFEDNDVKIYDVIAHHSFTLNKRDVNVKQTISDGYPDWYTVIDGKTVKHGLVYVHEWANKKTPHGNGRIAVRESTYKKICTVPRKDW